MNKNNDTILRNHNIKDKVEKKSNSTEEVQKIISENKEKSNKFNNVKNSNHINQKKAKEKNKTKDKNNIKQNKSNEEINEIVKDKIIEKEMPNFIEEVLQNNNLVDDDILIKNPKQLTLNLYYTMKHLIDAENKLKKQSILLDKALQDIVHKIEGDKFNVVEGYKLAKRIQIIRNKKNLIKESLIVYEKLNGLGLNIEDNMSNLSKIILEIEHQSKKIEYEPKVLKDLELRYDNETIYKKYEDIKKDDLKTIGINYTY